MDLGLTGKTAFVAGASKGLGFSAAKQLAEEGCQVAICSRDRNRIEAAAASLEGNAGSVIGIQCDVTREEDIQNAIDQAVSHFGGLDILVTNSGGPPTGFVDDFTSDDWRSGIELNLISTINLVRHALPHLREAAGKKGFAI